MKHKEKLLDIENDSLIQAEDLKEEQIATGVPIPDPEKDNDQWDKKPDMNIYYDQTADNS
jgi:hypothetical protein